MPCATAPLTRIAILAFCLLAVGGSASAADGAEKTVTHTVDLGGCGSVAIVIPIDFSLTKSPAVPGSGSVRVVSLNRKVSLEMFFMIPPEHEVSDAAALAKQVTEIATAQYLGGAVEKAVTLTEFTNDHLFGAYAAFTDASLVGKVPRRGQFTHVVTTTVRDGRIVMVGTLLANGLDSPEATKALAIVTGGITSTFTSEPPEGAEAEANPGTSGKAAATVTVAIPGKKAHLTLLDAGLGPIRLKGDGRSLQWAGEKDGFNLSIFVEPPANAGTKPQDVHDHYWPMAARNPLIEPTSVKATVTERFAKVTYEMVGSHNVNYYFVCDGKWVDVHISKLPYKAGDEALFAEFETALGYGE